MLITFAVCLLSVVLAAAEDTCYNGRGLEYSGTVSTTRSGRTCQRWDTKSPHSHGYGKSAARYPESSVAEAANYCRNPTRTFSKGLWCYTTDKRKRWELCDIPKCKDTTTTTTTTPAPTTTTPKTLDCLEGSGSNYIGTHSTTRSGRTCQRWDSNTPHKPNAPSKKASNYPDASIADAANYCRNTDGEPSPWCYTTDKRKRWEFCDVPTCTDHGYEDMGCWRNKIVQKLNLLERTDERLDKWNYKNRDDAINKCMNVAADAGYDFFAVGNKGQCWAGHGDIYQHYGQPRECPTGGKGKYGIVNVYMIKK